MKTGAQNTLPESRARYVMAWLADRVMATRGLVATEIRVTDGQTVTYHSHSNLRGISQEEHAARK